MNRITVITPIFNREELIKKAYQSLISQTNNNFEWLIIDDGSKDNTKQVVQQFIDEKKLDIKYIYKENGGKHTALNIAFNNLETELAIILDSDDCLTENAIEEILKYWDKYKENEKIAALVFLRGYNKKEAMTKKFVKDEYIGNYNVEIINTGFSGDKAEVFRSEVLRQYKFPEYEKEKFIGEGFIWSKISRKYDMVFINKIIYIGNYLEGGLTKLGKKLRINNPLGGMTHAQEYLDKDIYSMKVRIKNQILYNIYYFYAKNKYGNKETKKYKRKNDFLNMMIIPISFIIYIYWRLKY